MSTNDSIQRLAASLREAMDQIQAEHSRLAERPTLTASRSLNEAMARRDRLVSEIGRVVADALLANETLHFDQVEGAPDEAAPAKPATTPAPRPASSESTATRFVSRRTTRRPADTFDTSVLVAFIEELGEIDELDTIQQFDDRYQRLRYTASHPNRWIGLPAKAQRHLIGAAVALLRDLQEANEEFGRPLREPEIVGLVSRLSHWSKEHRPGWVNGMARGAVPDEGAWLADAQMHLAEVESMIDDGSRAPSSAYPPAAPIPAAPPADDAIDGDPIERTCPACSAGPGERCQTDSGRKLYSYHHKERR